ncbi:hypothetical protein SLS62_005901 [Diatrype stigma]|uniref:RING-type domain-containing protein n=1 Tax=Diatrype stigma TaxID=117547 RepID=A0AAN9US99_9PEZI
MAVNPWITIFCAVAFGILASAMIFTLYFKRREIARWFRILAIMTYWTFGIAWAFAFPQSSSSSASPSRSSSTTLYGHSAAKTPMQAAFRLVERASTRTDSRSLPAGTEAAPCPICLTPLFFDPHDSGATGADTGGEKQESSSASSFAPSSPEADLEAGIALPARPPHAVLRGATATAATATSTSSTAETLPSGAAAAAAATLDAAEGAARVMVVVVGGDPGVEGADAVLTLRSCRHTFHKRCLASWCLRWRYDCPVCREPYHCDEPVVVSYI